MLWYGVLSETFARHIGHGFCSEEQVHITMGSCKAVTEHGVLLHCIAALTTVGACEWECLTFDTMKFGALKVANNLDRFGHTSVFSNVENASATKAIRKPAAGLNSPSTC